jgi:hypothetical protein
VRSARFGALDSGFRGLAGRLSQKRHDFSHQCRRQIATDVGRLDLTWVALADAVERVRHAGQHHNSMFDMGLAEVSAPSLDLCGGDIVVVVSAKHEQGAIEPKRNRRCRLTKCDPRGPNARRLTEDWLAQVKPSFHPS